MKKIKYYFKLLFTNPKLYSFKNIKGFFQALYRKKLGGLSLKDYQYEQVIYRRLQIQKNSPKCWESETCIKCGCYVLDKTFEDRSCEGECYPVMMDKSKWEEYKEINQIKLFD